MKKEKFFVNSSGELFFSPEVTYLGQAQFKGRTDINAVYIPFSVKEIGESCFEGCSNLKKVIFEKNSLCTIIYSKAFYGCKNLREILFPQSLQKIQSRAFYNCFALSEVVLPINCVFLGEQSFGFCNQLQSVAIKNGNLNSEELPFAFCFALREIKIKTKKYRTVPICSSAGIVIGEKPYHERYILRVKNITYFVNGNIKGAVGFIVNAPDGTIGDGNSLKEAWAECDFQLEKGELRKRFRSLSLNDTLSLRDFRILTSACNIGSKLFAKRFKITNTDRWPLGKILWIVKETKFFEELVDFLSEEEKQKIIQ